MNGLITLLLLTCLSLPACNHLPQEPDTTRLCIDDWDCRDFPSSQAEFLVDYVCEETPGMSMAVVLLEDAMEGVE